jgi:hypothetical protein
MGWCEREGVWGGCTTVLGFRLLSLLCRGWALFGGGHRSVLFVGFSCERMVFRLSFKSAAAVLVVGGPISDILLISRLRSVPFAGGVSEVVMRRRSSIVWEVLKC